MVKIMFVLDDELEARFREAAFKKYGYRKGALSKFAEEIIKSALKEIDEEES